MNWLTRTFGSILIAVTLAGGVGLPHADASFMTFYGFDPAPVLLGGPYPSSDLARAAFLSGLDPSSVGIQNFETMMPVTFTGGSIPIAFAGSSTTGILQDLSSGTSAFAAVTNAPAAFGGFANFGNRYLVSVTSGNSSFFQITFSTPQQGFGFYTSDASDYFGISGIPPVQIVLDGIHIFNILNVDPGSIPNASVSFFGIISASPFTTVRIVNPPGTNTDGIGFDYFIIGQAAIVPEIHSCILLASAIALTLPWLKRRKEFAGNV